MRFLLIILLQFNLVTCGNSQKPFKYLGKKHNGIALVAPSKPINDEKFVNLKSIGSNTVAIMPYSFVPKEKPEVRFSTDTIESKNQHQWWGETSFGVRKCIDLAHDQGLEVMLKPHLWIGWGQFTGDLAFDKEVDWQIFEKSYKAYILLFAKIAEEKKVSTFCMATEMANHVKTRPEFWLGLIQDIRKVYHGKLTYAENWDSYSKVPFWDKLDFIGIDAYFPISSQKNPDIASIKKGWKKHRNTLADFSGEFQKPILFTEIGYKSNDYALNKPWESDFSKPANHQLQALAYKGFFEEIWNEEWFAGAYIWKWFSETRENRPSKDTFSPQNKPAQQILTDHFLQQGH
jgi:hypothetical protein